MLTRLILRILQPRWVVFFIKDRPLEATPEMGLQLGSVVIGLWKGQPIIYRKKAILYTRPPGKREFGESLHPH